MKIVDIEVGQEYGIKDEWSGHAYTRENGTLSLSLYDKEVEKIIALAEKGKNG